MAYPITMSPYRPFTDKKGDPLENGYIYIGTANTYPIVNPIAVYWDAAGTIPAFQPIRTIDGYPSISGSPMNLYVSATNFSIVVQDKNQVTLLSRPVSTEAEFGLGIINSFLTPWNGSSLIGYDPLNVPTGRTVENKLGEFVSVRDFGAIGNGAADDTVAIHAAVTSVGISGGGGIYFPAGIYLITSEILIKYNFVVLYGDPNTTVILFKPIADQICFLFDSQAANAIVLCGLKNLVFESNNTAWIKTAVKLVDVEGFVWNEVCSKYPHWQGVGSIFLHICGRQTSSFNNTTFGADRPILVSKMPAPHPAIHFFDHMNFNNMYISASTVLAGGLGTHPLIEVEDGVLITNVSFNGYQAWVGGSGGFRYVDTTTASVGVELNFNNVRHEQPANPASYIFHISSTAQEIQHPSFRNCHVGSSNGYYLRKVFNVLFENCIYAPALLTSIDIDSSVSMEIINCFWQTTSIANLGNMKLVKGVPGQTTAGIVRNGHYLQSTHVQQEIREYNNNCIGGTPFTIAGNGGGVLTHTIGTISTHAFVFIQCSLSVCAIFALRGGVATQEIIDPDGVFTNASGGVNYNVYWDAGDNTYKINNNTAISRDFIVTYIGSSIAFV